MGLQQNNGTLLMKFLLVKGTSLQRIFLHTPSPPPEMNVSVKERSSSKRRTLQGIVS